MKQNTTIEKKVVALHKEGWHVPNTASIARDGVVHRDEIYELDQISEDWNKEHNKEG